MRILIISYFFPPFNSIGAVRVGKIAKYLYRQNVDLRIITALNQPLPENLPLEIPKECIIATTWRDVNAPLIWLSGSKKSDVATSGYPTQTGIKKIILNAYKEIFHFPDAQIGWQQDAQDAAEKVVEEFKPDCIFASATPYTSLIIAANVAKKYKLPWFAELRDLWLDNPYVQRSSVRVWVESRLEQQVLTSATGLITVSEELALTLQKKYSLPVEIIKNGFDPEDYIDLELKDNSPNQIHIVYTGMIYENKRDPSPLFQAIQELGELGKQVCVSFYGRYNASVSATAKRYGILDQIRLFEPVSFQQSIQIQSRADLLLLLTWDNPADFGVYTGKFFEYLAAKRPIIALGNPQNVALKYIEDHQLGFIGQNISQLTTYLRAKIVEKVNLGLVSSCDHPNNQQFSREAQAKRLLDFMVTQS
jgi:glycosyltransferase involved in cell wall biosynthesis